MAVVVGRVSHFDERLDHDRGRPKRGRYQAWMAVDTTGGPFNGNIYVVWASDPMGAVDNSDVFFSRSTNGGAIWSAAVQIGAGWRRRQAGA